MAKKPTTPKSIETLTHDEDKRKNIPTAEFQSVLQKEQESPRQVVCGGPKVSGWRFKSEAPDEFIM